MGLVARVVMGKGGSMLTVGYRRELSFPDGGLQHARTQAQESPRRGGALRPARSVVVLSRGAESGAQAAASHRRAIH